MKIIERNFGVGGGFFPAGLNHVPSEDLVSEGMKAYGKSEVIIRIVDDPECTWDHEAVYTTASGFRFRFNYNSDHRGGGAIIPV